MCVLFDNLSPDWIYYTLDMVSLARKWALFKNVYNIRI